MLEILAGLETGEILTAIGIALATAFSVHRIVENRNPALPPPDKPVIRADWPNFENIPERPREIQGRKEDIKKLKAEIERAPSLALTGERPPERANIMAASGSGGIGKSELANEFARTYRQNYEGVWVVRAESDTTLHNDLALLGTKIGCAPDLEPREKALAVLQAVNERQEFWLIIYDNVTEQAAIKDYLITPPVNQSASKVQYLITSRSSQWENINSFPVGLLSEEEALALLRQVSGRDDKDMDEIVAKLDGYPLALVVAGAYLRNHHGASVASYLESFETRLNDTSAADYNPTLDKALKENYPRSILGSLSLSIDFLSDDAKDLLSLTAYLSPDDIWPELIEEGAKDTNDQGAHPWPSFIDRINADPNGLNTAITELKSASLLEEKDDRLTMHRLTQEVRRTSLGGESEIWTDTVMRMLNVFTPYEYGAPANWEQLDRLVPHLERLLEEAPASKAADRAIGQMGSYFRTQGNDKQAIILLEKALKISEIVNGGTSSLHGVRLNNLANAYKGIKQYGNAVACYKQAIGIERTGPRLNNLALLYNELERFEEAEALYLEAQELTQSTLGEDHPDYAIRLGNISDFYRDWGQTTSLEADKETLILEYGERALLITQNAHGHWHQDTATQKHNLSGTYFLDGKSGKAMDLMRRASVTRLQILRRDHPDTQVSLNAWMHFLEESDGDHVDIQAAIRDEITALRADHVKWGYEKIAELENRYGVEGLQALQTAVDAEYSRLKKEGALVEKSEWVKSEFHGVVFALQKGMEWGLIDPETGKPM